MMSSSGEPDYSRTTALLAVRADAILPAGEPAGFVLRLCVFHAACEDAGGGFTEGAGAVGIHAFEHLKHPPSLAAIALFWVGALAFEIHVIDQSVRARASGGELLEARADCIP